MTIKAVSRVKIGCFLVASAFLASYAVAQAPDEQSQSDIVAMPQMQQMQSRMQAMREQMARIHATADPEERQRLMQEHMQSMHEGMMTMNEMMRGAMAPGQARECQQTDTECRMNQMQTQQQMMGQRMGMMQQMMEQMVEQMTQGQTPEAPGGTSEGEGHQEHH
jgi:hypothetical protein